MFVKYIRHENKITINVGREHVGKVISTCRNCIPITTINRNGCAEILEHIFRKFKKELYIGEEKLVFEKDKHELV